MGSLTRELSSHGRSFSGSGIHKHGGCRTGTISLALPEQRAPWRVTGCSQVLVGEKLEGLLLENLQLALPLPPAWVGAVPAPGLRTLCRLLLLFGPSLPSPVFLSPPASSLQVLGR